MSETKGHPAAPILAEIAEAARTNPEFWREFEFHHGSAWHYCSGQGDLYQALWYPGYTVRRKPRTIRVNGNVSEETIREAENVVAEPGHAPVFVRIADALLSVVDES